MSKYPGSTEYTFVAEGDGLYGFEIHGEDPNPENLAVRATVEDFVYTAIEGNGASIENTDGGKHYYCLVTFADGSTEKSDDFIGRYAISDHPDESELNVDINAGKATYQWYKVNLGEEITDENTFVTHSFSGLGYEYTPEKGWEEKEIINGNSDFFAVKVEAGEAITVFVDGVVNGGTVLIDANNNIVVAEATPNAENMYILRPEKSGTYSFAIIATGDDAVTVRAFFGEAEFVEIEGATDNTYYPEEDGNYCCEVTFEDGTTERTSYVYYCPHKGETETFNVADKTCTVDGYTGDTKCTVCGKIIVYGEVISASHETETAEAKAATCTEIGWDAYEYCTECDYTTYAENPVVDHSDADNDGICDAGGEQLICTDCGRPLHDDSFVKNLICLIMSFINLIKSMF